MATGVDLKRTGEENIAYAISYRPDIYQGSTHTFYPRKYRQDGGRRRATRMDRDI